MCKLENSNKAKDKKAILQYASISLYAFREVAACER